jgi:hypothetical protein
LHFGFESEEIKQLTAVREKRAAGRNTILKLQQEVQELRMKVERESS